MIITAYGFPLSQVTSFNYLGLFIVAEEKNWPEVVRNLRHARQKWEQLTRILGREGVDAQISRHVYLVVVKSVLLYGS